MARRIGILGGIKFTMQSSFYPNAFARLGKEVITPTEPQQDEIERISFDELTRGISCQASRARLLEVIQDHAVDGVILGCTELPLLLQQKTPGRSCWTPWSCTSRPPSTMRSAFAP